MGNLATPESLIARWTELCRDQSLENLPYKIELNAWGKIELSPRTNRRGRLAALLAYEFHRQLAGGSPLISCGVLTAESIFVPDVAWVSLALMRTHAEAMLFHQAPEICVEICSTDDEEKVDPYLHAGANEVWLVSNDGGIRYFDARGPKVRSDYPVNIELPPPGRDNGENQLA